MQKARTVSQKERLQMLVWLKQGVMNSRSELAVRCHRNTSTINCWLARYKQGGLKALLASRHAPGANRKNQGEALKKLKARLAQPEGFSSYREIQQWLKQAFQLTVEYGTLYQVVRYKLKAKLKVPRPRALGKDPEKRRAFPKKLR